MADKRFDEGEAFLGCGPVDKHGERVGRDDVVATVVHHCRLDVWGEGLGRASVCLIVERVVFDSQPCVAFCLQPAFFGVRECERLEFLFCWIPVTVKYEFWNERDIFGLSWWMGTCEQLRWCDAARVELAIHCVKQKVVVLVFIWVEFEDKFVKAVAPLGSEATCSADTPY